MNKKFIIIRYPQDEQSHIVPENNAVFNNFVHAVICINGMLQAENRHRLQADMKEQPLRISLDTEVVELWICETRGEEEVNKID